MATVKEAPKPNKKASHGASVTIWYFLLPAITAVVFYGLYWCYHGVSIATAHKAKTLCSGLFVSGRDPRHILETDLAGVNPILHYVETTVSYENFTVSASLFGFVERVALYRPGFGCTMLLNTDDRRPQTPTRNDVAYQTPASEILWPNGDKRENVLLSSLNIDADALLTAVNDLFIEHNPSALKRTRAVVVLYKGHIVAEQYADGFTSNMPLLGWSMTKSVTSALIGILVKQDRLDIHAKAPVPEWRQKNTSHENITVDHLLRMSSGLAFSEVYDNPLSDATTMLYRMWDMGAYAATVCAQSCGDCVCV